MTPLVCWKRPAPIKSEPTAVAGTATGTLAVGKSGKTQPRSPHPGGGQGSSTTLELQRAGDRLDAGLSAYLINFAARGAGNTDGAINGAAALDQKTTAHRKHA